jgi:hypothetical protein
MDNTEIQSVLQILGERVLPSSQLFLVGGSALILLGSPRLTIDIDFIGDDIAPSELDQRIMQVARELKIYIEPVALERFIPIPDGFDERTIRIGQFGNLEVFVADPYSIALTKLDRGFDTDFDDMIFLVKRHLVDIEELERITRHALSHSRGFDMNSSEVLAHLQELKARLK